MPPHTETTRNDPKPVAPRRPRILLPIVIVSLICGFLSTVGVAWNSAYWRPIPEKILWHWGSGIDYGGVVAHARREPGALRRLSTVDQESGWFYAERPIEPWSELERDPVSLDELVIEDVRGFPFPALRTVWTGKATSPGSDYGHTRVHDLARHGGIAIRPRFTRLGDYGSWEGAQALHTRMVPLNFMADFVIHSFGFALLLLVVVGMRGLRIRRNLCPQCRYDLSGLEHERCPECGVSCCREASRWLRFPHKTAIVLFIVALASVIAPFAGAVQRHFRAWTIHEAALTGNVEMLRSLITDGVDVNKVHYVTNGNDFTALMLATGYSSIEAMRVLLEAGADPGLQPTLELNPPLIQTAFTHEPERLRLLIEHGADPNGISKRGIGILSGVISFSRGDMDMVKILIEAGADPSGHPNDRWPPLYQALLSDPSGALAHYLLDLGADPTMITYRESNMLHRAAYACPPLVPRLLTLGIPVNAPNIDGTTPLHIACNSRSADVEMIRMLLDHGADATARTKTESTTIIQTFSMFDEIIPMLLEHGANINALDQNGWTALMWAAANGWTEKARVLVSLGARLDIIDPQDRRAMDLAHDDVMRSILEEAKVEVDRSSDDQ